MQILLGEETPESWVQEYERTLLAPRDDMWAAFADMATTRSIVVDGAVVGFCSVDEADALHRLYVGPGLVENSAAVFAEVVAQLRVAKAYPCTIDEAFTHMCREVGVGIVPVGLMYRHTKAAPETPGFEMQIATEADLDHAIAFVRTATDDPEEFLRPYLSDRIAGRELHMTQRADHWVAIGECRKDQRSAGFAHVGMIVGREHRGTGVGTQVLSYLVKIATERGWAALCSTEPDNVAARKAIERVGFREYHQVLSVDL